MLGFEHVLDQTINTEGGENYRIIGVVKDFHFKSLHSKISPMAIILTRYQTMVDRIVARIQPDNTKETLAYIEKAWKEYGPGGAFKYKFYNEEIAEQYEDDKNFSDTLIV